MTVAAVMLVKDEADVIEHTLRHLKTQVDWVFVADNGSTDGTRELLQDLAVASSEAWLEVSDDTEVGYYQSEKTSDLARTALQRGFQWVVPCDADEVWYSTDGRPIREFLGGLAPDIAYVNAELFNHLPSALDPPSELTVRAGDPCPRCGAELGCQPETNGDPACPHPDYGGCGWWPVEHVDWEPNPLLRIGWRQRNHGALPKVACRLREGLEIGQGNHTAWAPGVGVTVGGLVVRHFSWRAPFQYLRKIRNGERAYAATHLDPSVGAHWRMFAGMPDSVVVDHFRRWFWTPDPAADATLIYDPAPVSE